MGGFSVVFVFACIAIGLNSIHRSQLSHQRFMRVLQLKADLNSKLMDRFGQDPALFEFLKSDAQHNLFDVKLQDPAPRSLRTPMPYMRMLTAVQISFMLLSGGVACLWFSGRLVRTGDQEGFAFVGALGIALGIGALLSAAAAYIVAELARRQEVGS